MNYSYTLKLNQLTPGLAFIKDNLIKQCELTDKTSYDIFSENNCNFADFNCFYMHFTDRELTGFLSIFAPSDDELYIYTCTHPKYRNTGIFNLLFNTLKEELAFCNISYTNLYFPLNQSDLSYNHAVNILSKHGMIIAKKDYLMQYDLSNIFIIKNPSNIELEYEENPSPDNSLSENESDANEQENEFSLWLGDIYIGGCLVYYADDFSVTIYQYGIVDEYQGKGYGKIGLQLILNYLSKKDFGNVILHVEGQNKKACSLYLSCGFYIIEETDYYSNK